jgi:hypothetical protein
MVLKKILFKAMNLAMHWLCITCRDTSPIISEMMDHKVSFLQYLSVKIHLAICRPCQHYKAQLETVNLLAYELANKDSYGNTEVQMSPEAKTKIKRTLKIENFK